MKRTLALILTLCMALSMFSFPALAAELDAAPLETAPVETQTTTPAETPAATGDVAAPAAAAKWHKVTPTVTPVSEATYGTTVTLSEPTIAGLTADKDYKVSSSEGTVFKNANTYQITWTVTLEESAKQNGFTFGEEDAEEQVLTTTVDQTVVIKTYDWAGDSAKITVTLTRDHVGETPELAVTEVVTPGNSSVNAEILAAVQEAAKTGSNVHLVATSGDTVVELTGADLSKLANLPNNTTVTGYITVPDGVADGCTNWKGGDIAINEVTLSGELAEGSVDAEWNETTVKYAADGLTGAELKDAIVMSDGSKATDFPTARVMTEAQYNEIVDENPDEEDQIAAFKKVNAYLNSGLTKADAGTYKIFVEASSSTMTGSGILTLTIAPYTEAEVQDMITVTDEDTVFAVDGQEHQLTVDYKEAGNFTLETDVAETTFETVNNNGSLVDEYTAPTAAGEYRMTVTTLAITGANNVVNVPAATKTFTFSIEKMGFFFGVDQKMSRDFETRDWIVKQTIADAADSLAFNKTDADDASLDGFGSVGFVTDGNGKDLTKGTEYQIDAASIEYYNPSNVKVDGSTKMTDAGDWVVKFTVVPTESYKGYYEPTAGEMTITVPKVSSNITVSLDFSKVTGLQDLEYGEWNETAAKALQKALDENTVKYGDATLTDYDVTVTYTAPGSTTKVPVTDLNTIGDAGTYTWTFSYEPNDGTVVNPVEKSFQISQKELKTLKILPTNVVVTENAPAEPTITVDNIVVSDLAKGDTKADLFAEMTFEWASTPDFSTVGTKTGIVKGTLDSVNYTVAGGSVLGDVNVVAETDVVITLTGETEVTYDGQPHTLEAVLSGTGAGDLVNTPVAKVVYKDEAGKTVSAPVAVGTYTVTATLADTTHHNAAEVVSSITILPATPTLTFKLPDTLKKAEAYDGNEHWAGLSTNKSNVTIAGVKGDNLPDTYLNLYWADASGNQLYIDTDEDGKEFVTTEETKTKVEDPKLPGEYYLTAQYVVIDPETGKLIPTSGDAINYTDSAVISEKFEITSDAPELSQITPYSSLKNGENGVKMYDVHYGDVLEGYVVAEKDKTDGNLAGKYVITKAATEKANKVESNKAFTLMFVPADTGYTSVELGTSYIDVVPAVLEKDKHFTINNTAVSYDEKAHYLGEAEGEGVTFLTEGLAFAGDEDSFKVEYSKNGSTDWTTDPSTITFTAKGGYAVYVKITDSKGNYEMPANNFMGKVSIGVVAATLKVEDKTVTYTWEDDPTVEVSLVDKDGKTLSTVPASEYTVEFHDATANANDKAFTGSWTNAMLHADEDAYWVKVSLKNSEYKGYSVEDVTAYARYTVNKADLDPAKLSETVVKTTLDASDKSYTGEDIETVLGTVQANGLVKTNDKAESALAGAWAWEINEKGACLELEVGKNYNIVYYLNDNSLLAPRTSDFNTLSRTITVKDLQPAVVVIDEGTPVVDPEESTYGITYGELTISNEADGEFTFKCGSKEIEGRLIVNEDAGKEIPVGDPTVVELAFVPDEGRAANYKLATAADGKNPVTVKVTITKATPTLEVTNTTMEYNGNPAALNVVTNSDANEASYTFVWRDENGNRITAAPTEVGSYQVTVTIPETANFESVSKTVNFEITYNAHYDGVEGFVTRLYQVALGRTPDASGYELWVNGLKSGEYTPEFVAYGFIFSREFTNKNLSNADFLTIMYNTFMDRDPDANGYAMWLNGLNSGEFTREFVFNGFVYSKEFTNICARYGL